MQVQSMLKKILLASLLALPTGAFAQISVGGGSSSVGTGFSSPDVTATLDGADVVLKITGNTAQTLYNNLDVDVRGPFSTGLCVPGTECDPPTFYGKRGDQIDCSKTVHTRSGRVDYSCELRVTNGGQVTLR